MYIDKDTLLFGSFSEKAGNVGCLIFNKCFQYYKLNAIYKSFSIDNLHDAIISAKCLGFSGFAVSMPFKNKILTYQRSFFSGDLPDHFQWPQRVG
jgi:shikimate dehydrogenase